MCMLICGNNYISTFRVLYRGWRVSAHAKTALQVCDTFKIYICACSCNLFRSPQPTRKLQISPKTSNFQSIPISTLIFQSS